eukprot:TRINITY_DN25822_c0_g1_i3.p1 TRINITY_DN25822_c0_g1~~TRINITY_DN25822_c0_g1_i3.p1  ORF type:complete len:365 (-),score=121.04 TRINITY_DN25822_c0_g1_i3:282-1376(-)
MLRSLVGSEMCIRDRLTEMERPEPALSEMRVEGYGGDARPVLTAIRAGFANLLRKKELAEAALESERIHYEMRLLDTEARMSSERALHMEEMEQLRRGRGGGGGEGEAMARELERLKEKLTEAEQARENLRATSPREQPSGPGYFANFLLKKGESTDIWRSRWVVLDDQYLKLYDPESTKPKSTVHLSKITKVFKSEKRPCAFVLELHHVGPASEKKKIHLDASRPDNARQWLQALQQAQARQRGGSVPGSAVSSPQVSSPRELELETDLEKLREQAGEDRSARTQMSTRLEQVESEFDRLASTMMDLDKGNWKDARRKVREQLVELELLRESDLEEEDQEDDDQEPEVLDRRPDVPEHDAMNF